MLLTAKKRFIITLSALEAFLQFLSIPVIMNFNMSSNILHVTTRKSFYFYQISKPILARVGEMCVDI